MTIPLAITIRRLGYLCLVALLLSPGAVDAAPADAKPIVVLISVDGLAGFYLDDARAKMPTIRALAAGGVSARMKASAPTVTWPNHTTLVTGVTPARHGVVGNNYYDRVQARPVALILDPEYDKQQIVKVPTIYDLAQGHGLKTAAVRWPATRNAPTLDWTVPEVASDELLHKYTTAALMAECRASGVWSDGEVVEAGPRSQRIISDATCCRLFDFILRSHRPNLALLHIVNVDHIEHLHGPRSPEAYAAIQVADEQVREIWEELKRDYAGKATLLVVSDHGFSPIEHLVLPNVVLRDAGLVKLKDNRPSGGAVQVIVQGGAAMLYVRDPQQQASVVEQVKQAFAQVEGIWKIVGPDHLQDHGMARPQDDPHAPDMILFAKEGYSFAETATGSSPTIEKSNRKGSHGHDENMPNLYALFVAWGRGIKAGAKIGEIRNIDVAPTIGKLLEVPMPATEGTILSAALDD